MSPTEKIDRDIKWVWILAVVSGSVWFVVVPIGYNVGYSGISAWDLINVPILLGLGFGVYKRSRVCSVLLTIFAVLVVVGRIIEAKPGPWAVASIFYLFVICRGTLAVFRHHALRRNAGHSAEVKDWLLHHSVSDPKLRTVRSFPLREIVLCPHCRRKNRLYKRGETGVYRCGACHTALANPFLPPTKQPISAMRIVTMKSVILFLARLIGIYAACLIVAAFWYHFRDPVMSAYQIGAAIRASGLREGFLFIAALLSFASPFLFSRRSPLVVTAISEPPIPVPVPSAPPDRHYPVRILRVLGYITAAIIALLAYIVIFVVVFAYIASSPQAPIEVGPAALPSIPPPTASLTTTPSPEFITLVKPVSIQTASGTITFQAGTNVRFISRDGDNVRFHYVNADYEIPVDATVLASSAPATIPPKPVSSTVPAADVPATVTPTNNEILFDAFPDSTFRGELTIENGTSHHAVAKLIDVQTDQKILSFVVGARQKSTIYAIPDGTYSLIFAFGDRLYEGTDRFNSPHGFSKFVRPMTFTTRSTEDALHWSQLSVTLHPVFAGNAKTSSISQKEFERY